MSLVGNAAVLVAGQLVSKLFTFSLNQLLLSYTSPSALGIAQLVEFVLDYTFFLSREAVRLTIAKLPQQPEAARVQWTINYSFATFVIYTLLGSPIVYWKIVGNTNDISELLYPLTIYHIIAAIAICVVSELLAESYYNINQYIKLDFKTRMKIESSAGFLGCLVQFTSVIFVSPELGLKNTDINAYVFGYLMGQMAYSVSIYLLYWKSASFTILKPAKVISEEKKSSSWFEPQSFAYFKSIFVQQIFKNFLTVGDRFVTTSLLSIQIQGYYSFISNYGSLIARMLFAPMEESTRITIGALFKDTKTEKEDFVQLSQCLSNVTKIYTYLLTLLVVFAPLNTRFLLNLVFKNFISDDLITAFKLYWVYVILLASNGILEALFQSLFNSKDKVNKYSLFMFANSVIFLSSLVVLISKFDQGLNGLIYANMINMLMRIVYCYISIQHFISTKSKSTGLSLDLAIVKRFGVFLSSAAIIIIFQYIYFHGEVGTWRQFTISAACGVFLVVIVLVSEFLPRLNRKAE